MKQNAPTTKSLKVFQSTTLTDVITNVYQMKQQGNAAVDYQMILVRNKLLKLSLMLSFLFIPSFFCRLNVLR